MERTVYQKLLEWKQRPDGVRKPLVMQGARQVGKTWLLEEFGRNEFESVAEINFEEQKQLANLFEEDFDTDRILRAVQIATGVQIVPGKTLIIFDEIQEAPRGVLSLKYLLKNAPQYHIVAAGSLLGVSLHKGESFPVGKVDFVDVQPLSFEEFLLATGREALCGLLRDRDYALISTFKGQFTEALKEYYFVGGMPEVVAAYSENSDFEEVRRLQNGLLMSYERDFSKHAPFEIVPRIKMVWDNIPSQLAKENKKFVYSAVRQGSRAKDFEMAIAWLENAGAVRKLTRINNASLPLRAFEDFNSFKLYLLDIGLLCAMNGVEARTIINGNELFSQYKGALTEQYVLQQLQNIESIRTHYWSPDSGVAEVDFVVQFGEEVIPIEVKAEENLKAKSLKSYCDKYHPRLAVRTSMSDYREQENLTNIPLYAISTLPPFVKNNC